MCRSENSMFLTILSLSCLLLPVFSLFDSFLAKKMVYLCGISYDDPAAISNWTGLYCGNITLHRPVVFNASESLMGFIGVMTSDLSIQIVFRGTDDLRNWMTDADITKVPYDSCSGCEVHKGIYDAYQLLAPQVHTLYQKFAAVYNNYDLHITGHSLGGALAVFCALDLKQTYGVSGSVYTFGQPRVGNQDFATYASNLLPEIYRVIDNADVIPHVPSLDMGYYHQGIQQWYHPNGMEDRYQCTAEAANCSNSIPDQDLSADDHHILKYMQLNVSTSMFPINLMTQSYLRKEALK